MADNKQLGVLQLSSGNVLHTIDKVNKALQNLGKGVDLDLSKIVDAKVTAELSKLQKQIAEVSKTRVSTSRAAATEEQKNLDSYNKMYLASLEMKTSEVRKAAQEQQRIQEWYTKQQRKMEDRVNVDWLKAKEKAAKEQQKQNEQLIKEQEQLRGRWGNAIATKVGAASLKLLKDQWKSAIDYASSYYDTLNEIRVVTGKSENDATKMGQNFRNLANEMKVTSTELSKAAVTFYRQGLNDSEVDDRLNWVTKYAKIANIDFETAAEQITASANAMSADIQGDIERVVDVFLYLGDAAATSGVEVGKAMQKASASATEFGQSFEWLGTYIATVAEQTRQAPEAIGNAFNSMMARMHQIKATGFNDEDTTKLNDVAKAQANLDIEMMDSQNNWRSMSDIYGEIAGKWDELDGKTKSYLATVMAGTRQQNVFFALMNDMSKGIEGGSRAWELYTGAMDAAGTASQKFTVWQESIAASQNNMNNALEQFYSNLQPGLIKGFYDSMAWLVEGLSVLKSIGVVLPVAGAAFLAFSAIITKFGGTMTSLAGIMNATKAAFATHPVFLFATAAVGIAGILGLLGGLIGEIETSAEKYEATAKKIEESNKKLSSLQSAKKDITSMLEQVQSGTSLTADEIGKYTTALNTIASTSPIAEKAMREQTTGFGDQATALATLSSEAEKAIESELKLQAIQGEDALRNYHNATNYKGYSDITTRSSYEQAKLTLGDRYGILRYAEEAGGTLYGYITQKVLDGTIESFDDTEAIEAAVENYFAAYEKALADTAKSEANTIIDDVIAATGEYTNTAQKAYLSEVLLDMLMGDDKNLDYEDVAESRIRQIWTQLLQAAKDALGDETEIARHELKDIALELFGEDTFAEIAYTVESIGENQEYAEKISSAYANMLASGQNNDLIKKAFQESLSGNGVISLNELMMDAFGWSDTEEFFSFDNEEISDSLKAMILNLIDAGAEIEKINDAFMDSKNATEFADALGRIRDELTATPKESSEYVKTVSDSISQYEKVQSIIDSIEETGTFDMGDILGLAEANPELLLMVNNLARLKGKLQELADLEKGNIGKSFEDLIKNSKEVFSASKYGYLGQQYGVSTLGELEAYYKTDAFKSQYLDGEAASAAQLQALETYYNYLTTLFTDAATKGEELQDSLTGIDKVLSDLQNVDKLEEAFKVLQDMENYDPTKVAEALQTIKNILNIKDLGKGEDIGTWLEGAKEKADEFTESANAAAEAYGILTGADAEAARRTAEARKEQEEYIKSMKELAQTISDDMAANKASSNGYADQINSLQNALDKGSPVAAAKEWKSFNKEIQSGIQRTYPKLAKTLAEIASGEGDMASQTKALKKELKNIETLNSAKYFKNTAQALYDVENYSKTAAEATSIFHTEEEKAIKAQLEFSEVTQKMAEDAEITTGDVSALADALGWTPQSILDNWDKIGPLMKELASEMENMRSQMQEEIFMNIVGSSNVDFSDVLNGLVAVEDAANQAAQALLATGEFEIEEKELTEDMNYFILDNPFTGAGHWEWKTAGSTVQVIKPKGSPSTGNTGGGGGSSKKSGGGGSGGGGGKDNTESEVTKMLNRMQEVYDLQKHMVDLYSAQANYYSETGQLQGVIKYYGKQKEAIEDQNKTIESQMKEMEPYLKQKEKELKTLDEASDEYKTCKDDLEKLQKQHQSYALELINNKTQVEQQTKAIQEQHDAIRQMQIDIENELYQAIEDREALAASKLQARIKMENEVYRVLQAQKEKQERMLQGRINLENEIYRIIEEREELQERMLQGRIDMENTILDLLKENYEEERDMILDNAQAQIDALQEERDLLSEQLQLRKELADQQDKEAKLADLEGKYARISADPTRQKEALSIRQQIDDLRDEMAWDLAEKQVKAKQQDIDDQIDSIEKYMDKIRNYYDELFKHPEELIAQMEEIMIRSDAEIIAWLQQNDSNYAASTAATQKNMVNTWESMLRDMHGQTVSYWDEVEQVIGGTDDEIIAWLTANDQTYQNSSAATRADLLNGWEEMLMDMHGYNEDLWGEVEQIMKEYGDNIVEWLEANDEEYANSTKAQQEDIKNNWAQMLREMKGEIVTYWDEVHSIMEQGDDAIIEFLMANSSKYKAASQQQAEAYLSSWTSMLSELHTALAEVSSDIPTPSVPTSTSGGGTSSSSSSGGGGRGGGGDSSTSSTGNVNVTYAKPGGVLGTQTYSKEPGNYPWSAFSKAFAGYIVIGASPMGVSVTAGSTVNLQINYQEAASSTEPTKSNSGGGPVRDVTSTLIGMQPTRNLVAFDTGGTISGEGIAYVHDKERVLTGPQNELFERLVQSLDMMNRISVGSMPMFGQNEFSGNNGVSVGDIIVNVDRMETDADYEQMAERVLEAIMEKLNRGSAVGGIRFSR